MRLLLLLSLFYIFSVSAQVGTGCCRTNSNSQEIIPDRAIATSCIICNQIHLKTYDEFQPEIAIDSNSEQYTSEAIRLEKLLKICHQEQDLVVKSIKEFLIELNSLAVFSKNAETLTEGLKNLSIVLNVYLSSQLETLNVSKTKLNKDEYNQCKNNIEQLGIKLNPKLLKIFNSLTKLNSQIKDMKVLCHEYTADKTETELLEELDSILKLETYIISKE